MYKYHSATYTSYPSYYGCSYDMCEVMNIKHVWLLAYKCVGDKGWCHFSKWYVGYLQNFKVVVRNVSISLCFVLGKLVTPMLTWSVFSHSPPSHPHLNLGNCQQHPPYRQTSVMVWFSDKESNLRLYFRSFFTLLWICTNSICSLKLYYVVAHY